MPVANTASPTVSPTAPYASPRNVRPSSSTRRAGAVTTHIVRLRPRSAPRAPKGPCDAHSPVASQERLAVEDGRLTAQEGRHHPGRQLPAGVRGVPAAAGGRGGGGRPARGPGGEHQGSGPAPRG